MPELVVPDPRKHAVPPGWWCDVALPQIEAAPAWEDLDGMEGSLKAYISYVEQFDGDVVEFEKAMRCIERRRGQLLGPRPGQGRRTDLQLHQTSNEVSDVEVVGEATIPEKIRERLSGSTMRNWQLIAEHWDDVVLPQLAKSTTKREVTQIQVLNLIREHTPARPDVALLNTEAGNGRWAVRHGDFRDVLADLDDASVDLFVTDPPYPKEDLALWSDLAKVAARVLGPRGLLFAWSGQLFLPEVFSRIGEHLTYGWTFALHLPGSSSRIMGRHMVQAWKPVVAFSTGTWPSGEWGDDFLISPERDKTEYAWQQNAAPARRLIERYSAPDGLVVDPFLGTGAFGVATLEAGRRFLGVELDAGRYRGAVERIESVG